MNRAGGAMGNGVRKNSEFYVIMFEFYSFIIFGVVVV
jgi:hypothetical protein